MIESIPVIRAAQLTLFRVSGHSKRSLSYGRAFTYLPVYITLGAISMVTMVFAFLEATLAQLLADRVRLNYSVNTAYHEQL